MLNFYSVQLLSHVIYLFKLAIITDESLYITSGDCKT